MVIDNYPEMWYITRPKNKFIIFGNVKFLVNFICHNAMIIGKCVKCRGDLWIFVKDITKYQTVAGKEDDDVDATNNEIFLPDNDD